MQRSRRRFSCSRLPTSHWFWTKHTSYSPPSSCLPSQRQSLSLSPLYEKSFSCMAHSISSFTTAPCLRKMACHHSRGRSMVWRCASSSLFAVALVWPLSEMDRNTWRRDTRISSLTTWSASSGWMCSSTSDDITMSNELSSYGRLVRMPGSTNPLESMSGHSFSSTARLSSMPYAFLPCSRISRTSAPLPVPASSTVWNCSLVVTSTANRHPQHDCAG
mmetsp:Transcript_13818/g.33114  ORF Transcript_13818/g.33114 Transcript_13818/m.33114 type:complete len:218 (-) Transcript_13818:364-1017(-)